MSNIFSFFKKPGDSKRPKYPFTYLVDRSTLIAYMNKEEEFGIKYNLESTFRYYLYQNGQKIAIEALHEDGDHFYFGDSKFDSIEKLISKIEGTGPFLIELMDSDDTFLNEYRDAHPELNIEEYIEKMPKA